jgi:type I restriction enzyme S subunit
LVKSEIEKYKNKTTQANVGIKSIQSFVFPLPPLAEQKRIVAKVDQLMTLCDTLETHLRDTQAKAEALAAAVVGQLEVLP